MTQLGNQTQHPRASNRGEINSPLQMPEISRLNPLAIGTAYLSYPNYILEV